MTLDKKQKQTSFYLVRRAEALIGALKFFAAEAKDEKLRLVQFVTQSDFREWELDNLVYSFAHLAERQATWGSEHARTEKLANLGIRISARLSRQVRWQGEGGWDVRERSVRVAPVDLLRQAIDLWNALLLRAEEVVIGPMSRDIERWNIDARKDLRHLIKKMPTEEQLKGVGDEEA